MLMGHHATPPLRRLPPLVDPLPLVGCRTVGNAQHVFAPGVPLPLTQAHGDSPCAHGGTAAVRRWPRQRGHGAGDGPPGVLICRGPCWTIGSQAPPGPPRRRASDGRLIDNQHLPLVRPRLKEKVAIRHKRRWLLQGGCELTRPQTPLAQPQVVQQRAHPCSTLCDSTPSRKQGPQPRGRPQTHMGASMAWTLPAHRLALGALPRVQAGGTARHRGAWQPGESLVVDRVSPEAHGLFVTIQPRGNVGTGCTIAQKPHGMLAFAQPHSMALAQGGQPCLPRHTGVGNLSPGSTSLMLVRRSVRPRAPQSQGSFLALL
jgi:hypothetical protein